MRWQHWAAFTEGQIGRHRLNKWIQTEKNRRGEEKKTQALIADYFSINLDCEDPQIPLALTLNLKQNTKNIKLVWVRYVLTTICNKVFVSLGLPHAIEAGVFYCMILIKVNSQGFECLKSEADFT